MDKQRFSASTPTTKVEKKLVQESEYSGHNRNTFADEE
jgi:hypothetical protein